ncbi:MAG: SPASM domain-containing protein [Theionarchaea archaeon]|nr:SPASM domain-containing protein [Theionarchaea archaeon]
MKLSRYVFFVPTFKEGKYALYNSFNNSIAAVDDELKTILESEMFSKLPPQHIQSLKSLEVLREDEDNELDMLAYKKRSLRYDPTRAEFHIIPTYKCNMQCSGCTPRSESMDDSCLENTLKAVKKEAIESKTGALWTFIVGGEPFLEEDITFRLSQELSKWAEEEGITFLNSIATNGTLLSNPVLERIHPYVSSMQVTLEGPKPYHDGRRTDADGRGTFDEAVKAIILLQDRKIHTVINVPVTIENYTTIPDLIEYLKEMGIHEGGITHVRLFFSSGYRNGICYQHSPLCNEGDVRAEVMKRVWEGAWERGFRATAKPTQTPYCTCIRERAYTIDPLGNVYKCVAMAGNPAERVATIENGAISPRSSVFYEMMSRDVTRMGQCASCKYRPLCAGGCLLRAREEHDAG